MAPTVAELQAQLEAAEAARRLAEQTASNELAKAELARAEAESKALRAETARIQAEADKIAAQRTVAEEIAKTVADSDPTQAFLHELQRQLGSLWRPAWAW